MRRKLRQSFHRWTARSWIIVGVGKANTFLLFCRHELIRYAVAAVVIVLTAIAGCFLRRRLRKRRERLPGHPNAPLYQPGEYWAQRERHLPGYVPPAQLLPVTSRTPDTLLRVHSRLPAPILDSRLHPVPVMSERRNNTTPARTHGPAVRVASR